MRFFSAFFSAKSFLLRVLDFLRLRTFMGKAAVVALPYGWHIIFFLIPFLIVLKISFSQSLLGAPPYSDLFSWFEDDILQLRLNLGNYFYLGEDNLYLAAYWESIRLSGFATLISLLIGYPIAYGIARVTPGVRIFLLLLIILPFWTSFLIRVYAWIGLLNNGGLINTLLLKTGMIQEPLSLMHNDFAVCLGIVYSYLPFMILPLYVSLDKINPRLLEAAHDLGCKPVKSFFLVTLPLSLRGAIAGGMLVFIPGVGEYIIPELLGGSESIMVGKILWSEFFVNRDWPLASALAISMLVLLVLPIIIFQRLLSSETEKAPPL